MVAGPSRTGRSTRVAVDAMGGDYAPEEIVKGAILAAQMEKTQVLLVGPTATLEAELAKYNAHSSGIRCVEAKEYIKEGESPVSTLLRKPDASVAVAAKLVKNGEADAMVSMGSTGAVMVSAFQTLGTFEGIERPVVAGPFLGFAPNTVVLDCGANVDCKPHQLLSFAIIGSVFAQKLLNIPNPTVALLSVGAEEGKGNSTVKDSYDILKKSGLNFIGNVEGGDIPSGRANVIVCDGFVGNILVKFCESLGKVTASWLKSNLNGHLTAKELEGLTSKLISLTNAADVYGGVPLLGVDGVVIVGHGRNRAKGVAKAIYQAKVMAEIGVVDAIKSELGKIRSNHA